MHQLKKAVFKWSGGKNSALALHKILQHNDFEVIALLTTINKRNKHIFSPLNSYRNTSETGRKYLQNNRFLLKIVAFKSYIILLQIC